MEYVYFNNSGNILIILKLDGSLEYKDINFWDFF